jgi:hypothetical protein
MTSGVFYQPASVLSKQTTAPDFITRTSFSHQVTKSPGVFFPAKTVISDMPFEVLKGISKALCGS